MNIIFQEHSKTFHLYNDTISYIMSILPTGHMAQLYFGKHIHHKEDFSYLVESAPRPMASYLIENDKTISLEHIKQEYGVYGTTDYRESAVEILQANGSRISDFQYSGHMITSGKPKLTGLPATYTEDDSEAMTLTLQLKDIVTGMELELLYTIFCKGGIIARSARFTNHGSESIHLTKAMSLCMDLPDYNYDFLHFSGAWARERHLKTRKLEQGIQSVGSLRGHSSHEHNPFIILKRPTADEFQGEAIGFSLIYSGNFLAQVEVDTHASSRVLLGIHPDTFDWKLESGESFQTPEAVMVYSDKGLNHMSQTFQKLYQKRLARGVWRDKARPILINNWEATYFDFNEDKILEIAHKAKESGVELFVLDDGWFGGRRNEHAGLGDWIPNPDLLPHGIAGLSQKIEELGMKFGLWFEPEMINKDSDLYRAHPDWMLQTPQRNASHGRYQFVLDFSRKEVVDHIYQMMAKILDESHISYIKWDMNRSITECYSAILPADRQGEVFHRYILGVYDLYERLTSQFPEVLFESCASGGARFDPGMLYYAPQCWTSDDTDAIERLKIQYGTSYCYPISSMGSHVSVTPNHQLARTTPLHTRANVAYFGTFGYELDLNKLTKEEQSEVKEQIIFMKKYRQLIQFGTFYRLSSPFESNITMWMVVSGDKTEAIVGWYKVLNTVNDSYTRIQLKGLDPDLCYENTITGKMYYGDELMNLGLITTDVSAGEAYGDLEPGGDFDSRLYIFKAK
ncbi:alpha-galactosidase [Bariatricus sp. SGI.161]|uniref:alpha-galactosidase n=1 Tax=Lachnospiraceae TaxID=186803 RepID=UPI002A7E259A|nr:alpha-galactosidase [Lachnospiraceae bacterium]MCI6533243.1 alpha-galactosidase [Lachnospiraceae bacterium]MDY2614572.1 alpha-galactosidase [Lachnospiraceae bacterium]MDY4207068.1 alpha-galactosidase [Lachnospiraceae bacterium]